jgi:uncharacterized protein (TIGR00730 family)
MNEICVFCGSSTGKGELYRASAKKLALLMAKKEMNLVFGGSSIGLMRILADVMIEKGRKVTGIMPEMLISKEILHEGVSKIIRTDSMHERKLLMGELSDAFIALPGGFGTLDEISEVLTWNQLEINNKPIALLNVDGYYDSLMAFLDRAVQDGFLRAEHRANIIVESDEEKLLEALENFKRIEVDSKWVDELKEQVRT